MLRNSFKVSRCLNHFTVFAKLIPKVRPELFALAWSRNFSKAFPTAQTAKPTSGKPTAESVTESVSLGSTCELIKAKIRSEHGSKFDYQLDDISNIVDCLSKGGVEEGCLIELFAKQPELCSSHGREWQSVLTALRENGIGNSDMVEMLTVCPQLLKTNGEKIHQAFDCLREHGFADKSLASVVSNAPILLVTNPKFIAEQIRSLMTMFTHKDIVTLARKCPNVLFEDFEDIELKVQYIVHEIGVDQTQIVRSSALAHSLSHIQLRHQIMIRVGLYKKPHPKKRIENVPLSLMVDSSINEFIDKIVGISLEEFSVFEKMFDREMEKQRNKIDSAESDSD